MTSLDESEQLEYIVSLQRQLQDYKYGVVKKKWKTSWIIQETQKKCIT